MEDFTGFRFGNWHTKDLNLVVVSSSDRYDKNLLPENNDYITEIPGGNGSYYFGNTFQNREFSVNVAYNNVSEEQFRLIQNMFATDKLEELVFDEEPYKTYKAKVKSAPNFQFLCFTDRKTGQRVYKGEGQIDFICYHPFAYCYNKYLITANDYYRITKPPFKLIYPSINEPRNKGPYKKLEIDRKIKEFYNVKSEPFGVDREKYNKQFDETDFRNDEFLTQWVPHGQQRNFDSWEGGYPTFEQVRKGELFFNAPYENPFSKRLSTVNPIHRREKYTFKNDEIYETDSPHGNMTKKLVDYKDNSKDVSESTYVKEGDYSNYTARIAKEAKETSSNKHIIFDARQYTNNLEEWAHTSGLATTPTLNNRQELMYLPQISKHTYCNLDTGKIEWTGITGNTILIYNPGDLPIDFDLKILANTKYFEHGNKEVNDDHKSYGYGWKQHGREGTRFQVRRYNVQELSIVDAVDWCDMQPLDGNEADKYGPHYFDIDPSMYNNGNDYANDCVPIWYSTSHGKSNHTSGYGKDNAAEWYFNANTNANNDLQKNGVYIPKDLMNGNVKELINKRRQNFKELHPKHCYMIEPIPRNQLGDYIRLFYWQTVQVGTDTTHTYARNFRPLTKSNYDLYERGIWYADQYDKKYKRCRTEREKNKLYWKTIDEAIIKEYKSAIERIKNIMNNSEIKKKYGIDIVPIDLKKEFTNKKNDRFYQTIKTYHNEMWGFYNAIANNDYSQVPATYEDIGNDDHSKVETYSAITRANNKKEFSDEEYYNNAIKNKDVDALKNILYQFLLRYEMGSEEELSIEELARAFKYSWIWNFPQYIYRDKYLKYNENEFNKWTFPSYYTDDYFEVNADTLVDLLEDEDCNDEIQMSDKNKIFFSSEQEALYTNIDKRYSAINNNFYYPPNQKEVKQKIDDDTFYNRFDYKPKKKILNDAIRRGHWFKLPPGYSVIQILPITDEWERPERTWFDARQFYWGFGGRNQEDKQETKYIGSPQVIQSTFDFCYENALRYFFQYEFDGIGYILNHYDQITTDGRSDGDQLMERIGIDKGHIDEWKKLLRHSSYPYELDHNGNFIYSFGKITYTMPTIVVSDTGLVNGLYNEEVIEFLNNFRRYGSNKLKLILNANLSDIFSNSNINNSFYYRPNGNIQGKDNNNANPSEAHKHSFSTIKQYYTEKENYNQAREDKRLDETPTAEDDKYKFLSDPYDYRFGINSDLLCWKLYYEWCIRHKNEIELRFLEIVQLIWNCVAPLNRNARKPNDNYFVLGTDGIYYRFNDLNKDKWDQNGDSFKNSYTEEMIEDMYMPFIGNINEWWWYACNYLWANFPPPYWGYMDFINQIEIKYIPEYY